MNEIVNDSNANQNEDVEMTEDGIVMVKEEKSVEKSENTTNGDDDDVIVLPQEEPVITEIPDETEAEQSEMKEQDENQMLNATDEDVMIQEPKIETQIVNDDDDDELNRGTLQETSQPLIVKIKEEPKDDGYEDEVNEEDPFVEVTSINEDDLMLGKYRLKPYMKCE